MKQPLDIARMTSPALDSYYSNRQLMYRNIGWILISNLGMASSMRILQPLMNLRLNAVGVSESGIGLIASINLWAVSLLVMYFSWKSDHLVSSWGRRIPYLLLSLPFIIITIILFPMFNNKWILIGLTLINLYFVDVKGSTYPLLFIDCVPRNILARVGAVNAVVSAIGGFLTVRYGAKLNDYSQRVTYILGGTLMTATALLAACKIIEPPIFNPTTQRFTFFAPMRIAWRDKRSVLLMIAIAMLGSASAIFNTWLWFYARDTLRLTVSRTGAAVSWSILVTVAIAYPAGWVIDRLGSYLVLVLYWCLVLLAFVIVLRIGSARGLALLSIIMAVVGTLYSAGEMILLKQVDPAHVGSVTSTNSFVRNLYTGSIVFISGYVVQWTRQRYVPVFAIGLVMTTASIVLFFFYRNTMLSEREIVEGKPPLIVESQPASAA